MDEYISREDVFQKAKSSISVPTDNEWDCGYNTAMAEMKEFIKKLPSADVQPVDRWISVNDRLPNNYEEVLVASKLGNIVYFAWYDADISMFMGHSHMWTTREVTHWMPLPEPPKDGDEASALIGEDEDANT